MGDSQRLTLRARPSRALSEQRDEAVLVPTLSAKRLDGVIEQLASGAIGVAGSRGTGKTTLIRRYCSDDRLVPDSPDLRLMVSAPVNYAAHDFVLYLFDAVCNQYLSRVGRPYSDERPDAVTEMRESLSRARQRQARSSANSQRPDHVSRALVIDAERCLDQIRYTQTRTTQVGGKAGALVAEVSGQVQDSIVRTAWTYPQTVAEFRRFLALVAREAHARSGRVFIGIDELDKISNPDQAERLINELKGIFEGVPYCVFMVAVSEEALLAFQMRGMDVKDAFDSAFDEIVEADRLDLVQSMALLRRRVVGVALPFVGLCFCLAGGLPRDLVRVARDMIELAKNESIDGTIDEVCTLTAIASILGRASALNMQLRQLRTPSELSGAIHALEKALRNRRLDECLSLSASINEIGKGWRLGQPDEPISAAANIESFAAHTYYCLTLIDFFRSEDLHARFSTACETGNPGSLDSLARALQLLIVDRVRAWVIIDEFRESWAMPLAVRAES